MYDTARLHFGNKNPNLVPTTLISAYALLSLFFSIKKWDLIHLNAIYRFNIDENINIKNMGNLHLTKKLFTFVGSDFIIGEQR